MDSGARRIGQHGTAEQHGSPWWWGSRFGRPPHLPGAPRSQRQHAAQWPYV